MNYMKSPNLHLIGIPESNEENETKLKNTLQDIIQENYPTLEREVNIQNQEIHTTKKSNPKAHNHQIHQGGNEGKNVKGSQRARLG